MMNSLFYYLVTAHEHQKGYNAVSNTTTLYHENKDLFESLWKGAIANCDKSGINIEEFEELLAVHGLYIQFEANPWNYKGIKNPAYAMELRIYPVEVGNVACLKVFVQERKE